MDGKLLQYFCSLSVVLCNLSIELKCGAVERRWKQFTNHTHHVRAVRFRDAHQPVDTELHVHSKKIKYFKQTNKNLFYPNKTSGSAIAEGPREALVSRNPATTKHLT